MTTTDDLPPSSASARRSLYLDTGDQLYVGGVPAHAYNALPAEVRSRDGFVGCLAELRLDGAPSPVDLLGNPFGIPELYRRQIRSGCPEWDVNGSGKKMPATIAARGYSDVAPRRTNYAVDQLLQQRNVLVGGWDPSIRKKCDIIVRLQKFRRRVKP